MRMGAGASRARPGGSRGPRRASRRRNNGCLPPGQAKKRYAVGHPLAPGIAYGPVPPELAVRIGPPPPGYLYVSLDGDLLKAAAGTALVVDAIDGLVD